MARTTSRILFGCIIGTVLGLVLREGLFVLGVALVARVADLAGSLLALLPWADPVYTHAALHSLAEVQVRGVEMARPLDAALMRVVLQPGSSVLGRLSAAGMAHVLVLAIGLAVLRRGVHDHSSGVLAASIACQLQVVASVVSAPPSMTDFETVGLSFAVNAILPSLGGRRLVISDLVTHFEPGLVAAVLAVLALMVAYGLAAVMAVIALRVPRARARERSTYSARRVSLITSASLVAISGTLAACTIANPSFSSRESPVGPVGRGQTDVGVSDGSFAEVGPAIASLGTTLQVGDRWYQDTGPPSRVDVIPTSAGFEYLVNGVPQIIRGMGFNTQYGTLLSPGDRQARLEADMTELQDLGVNTLVGWDPGEFDSTLLDTAQRHGIGVVMPFDLRTDADYTDPSVRATLTQEVLAWVEHYRAYPALRMWGLGNEVLHKLVHPAWVGPQNPHQAAEARAFADWLVETADAIHAADPDHPVTYRDAEDAFVGWIAHALERHPAAPRAWFVYGTNCYQDYLSTIVDNWPDEGMGLALWVSEFAPGGLAIPDRPDGFRQMWGYVRKHPNWVLGGAVYAWTRNGPEEIDRNLGLTDDGKPADGRSLDAIRATFTVQARSQTRPAQ